VTPPAADPPPISAGRKWAITMTVMVVAFMQILDTSVTNVVLPHLQGSLSAGLDEVSWVITSYLAANAIVIPATGWLVAVFGRTRFFLICCTLFTVSSFISGAAPDLTTLIVARIFQGLGGGPIIPLSQAILWEIFPIHQRGVAMAVWGVGFILGPILGPTGRRLPGRRVVVAMDLLHQPAGRDPRLCPGQSLPVRLAVSAQARADRRVGPRPDGRGLRVPAARAGPGRARGVVRLLHDRGDVGHRGGRAGRLPDPRADGPRSHPGPLRLHDRNFATGATLITVIGFGMFSSMLLVAVFTQKLLGYDAWTAGLVLAPSGLGNVLSLFASGIVMRVDQRLMLGFGCLLNAVSLYMMTSLTLDMDYWALALPRLVQGIAVGFIFVPLSTLTLATIRRDKLVNATAVYGMMRNIGGSVGIATVTTLLAQRSQFHQATLVSHINVWDPETRARMATWTHHFATQGTDAFTAERRAVAMLYRETVTQAQLLAYTDDFWLLALLFAAVPLLLPFMRRIRLAPPPAEAPGAPERGKAAGDEVLRDAPDHM
jgi:DHA2 family multidrug resistance protein